MFVNRVKMKSNTVNLFTCVRAKRQWKADDIGWQATVDGKQQYNIRPPFSMLLNELAIISIRQGQKATSSSYLQARNTKSNHHLDKDFVNDVGLMKRGRQYPMFCTCF